jgi:hypothetical protein
VNDVVQRTALKLCKAVAGQGFGGVAGIQAVHLLIEQEDCHLGIVGHRPEARIRIAQRPLGVGPFGLDPGKIGVVALRRDPVGDVGARPEPMRDGAVRIAVRLGLV